MRRFPFLTLDVFTDTRFGGNPLAVFPDACGLSDSEMQSLAAEFNLSETTFVLPPDDPANTARVRIFNRTAEMPFAGHPNVGTGFALAHRAVDGLLRFEEIAGLVEVRVDAPGEGGGATVAAPQPLSLGAEMPPELLAPCLGLLAADVLVAHHRPVLASCGNSFVLAEVTPEALPRAAPDLAAFRAAERAWPHARQLPQETPRLPIYAYARTGQASDPARPGGATLRARMFSPLSGTIEDAATGSAATPLAALLCRLGQGERFEITQGVEMGRPSTLRATAVRGADGVRASVGGGCVRVLEGVATL
jgi:trans-2,3-dihydro-3-hydroxyanthranilate isomerase